MLTNYLKVALRAFRRHPVYVLVSVGSLAIGFASCLVIYLYVQDEMSYDRFHPNAERTYRLTRKWEESGFGPDTPATVGPIIAAENPNVRSVVRVFQYWHEPMLSRGEQAFIEKQVYFVDSTFFDVFGFSLTRGDPEHVLEKPMSIVLSQEMADKYFRSTDPVGKRITYNVDSELLVTGVMANPPSNAHFKPAALVSIESLPTLTFPSILESWGMNAFKTYVTLREDADPRAFSQYVDEFYKRHRADSTSIMEIQPLTDIHLRSHLRREFEDNGDVRFLYLLSGLGVLILLIAAINYTNLATARAFARGAEVGMRKAVGAGRNQLFGQFLGESLVLTATAALVSIGPATLGLQLVNNLTGKNLSLGAINIDAVPGIVAVVLLATLAAGVYPAFVLSRFRPVRTLKGYTSSGRTAGKLRKGLVVVQFVASIALIAGSLVISRQIDFLTTSDVGFKRDHVLVLPVEDQDMRHQYAAFRDELKKLPGVISVGASNQYPGAGHASSTATWQGAGADEEITISADWIFDGFEQTLGIELAAGRYLDRNRESDIRKSVTINEAVVRAIGWTDPHEALGKWISCGADERKEMEIVGVVKDYNFESMHSRIAPLIFYLNEYDPRHFFVRIRPTDIPRTLSDIHGAWDALSPSQPFIYSFLDTEFNRLYLRDERWGQIMGYATTVAIIIACLGLFGLTSYSTAQRAKEIGIRKVLGSSAGKILVLMSRDIVVMVSIAFLVATPLAWAATNVWLESFAYRAQLGPGSFLAAGLASLVVALLTVAHLVIKAAVADPVKSLRYE